MRIDIFSLQPEPMKPQIKKKIPIKEIVKDFKTFLKEGLKKVNDAQIQSQRLTKEFAEGKVENVHDVMIAAQKAEMTMEFTTEIVRSLIRAYHTLIMRL